MNVYIWKDVQDWQPGANTYGYYTFDDQNSSQITDSSGNNRNLTGNTMPTYTLVSGTNYAGNFAGTGSKPPCVSYSGLSNTCTVLVWINISSITGSFITSFSSINVGIGLSSEIYFWNNSTSTSIKTSPSTSTRYLVGFTQNGSSVKTYLDGVGGSTTTMSTSSKGDFYIGGDRYGDRMQGLIGECVVEDKTWTDQDVLDYYNQTKYKYGL